MSSLPTHFHPHLPVSHSDSPHPPQPPPYTPDTQHAYTSTDIHTQHPDPTPAMPPESPNEYRSRQNCMQITQTRTCTELSAAPAMCNIASSRHSLEYPSIVCYVKCQQPVSDWWDNSIVFGMSRYSVKVC